MQKIAKNRHLGKPTIAQICPAISSQLRHVSTIGNKLVKQQYLLHPYVTAIANFSLLTADICWRVWGTPSNFNRFRVLASLLYRRRSTEVNKTLQYVWPSSGLVHYIHFLGLLPPNGILPAAKFTLCPSPAFSYIGSVTARHSSSGHQPSFVAWYKEWNYGTTELSLTLHLHSAGWPSRWTSAHILVLVLFCLVPCGRLRWLFVGFWAHVNVAHRIVSYRILCGCITCIRR